MNLKRFQLDILGPILIGSILTLVLGVFIFANMKTRQKSEWERMIDNNQAILSISSELAFNPLYQSDIWTLESMLNKFIKSEDIVYAEVRDSSNTLVVEAKTAKDIPTTNQEVSKTLAAKAFSQQEIVQYKEENYLTLCGPITTGTERIGTLEIVIDLAPYHQSVTNALATMTLSAAFTIIFVILLSIILARHLTRPLKVLASAAQEIGQGNLKTQVPIIGTKETTMLGNALERMKSNLSELYNDLEEQIRIQKDRAEQLQITAEVAQRAAAEIETPTLLQRVVNLMQERFSFYRLGIFLVDSSEEWVELQAATGTDMQQLLSRRYRLEIGKEGIVGRVAETGKAYIAKDTREDPYFVHALEEEALSEAALPLQARGEILGVLDLQSRDLNAFSSNDMTVYQILADQIAMALSNANLFKNAQENLRAVRQAYGEFSREAWTEMLQAKSDQGYYCDTSGIKSIKGETRTAQAKNLPEADIPITVRGQVIGTLNAHKSEDSGQWTEEELAVMKSIAVQLGTALDAARLYKDTQKHVARETVIREITDKISVTFNIEETLHTAIGELSKALRASGAHVELNLPKELTDINETTLAYSTDTQGQSLEEEV